MQFLCVAFQKRVAFAVGGMTIHTGGDVAVGGAKKSLQKTNVDVLFTRNQHLRFVLLDEVGMVPDSLLGEFEQHLTDAARKTIFSHRANKTSRPYGGYNLLTFGDLYQIPPIPSTAAVFIPSTMGKTQLERAALNLFWSEDNSEAFNVFWELQVQKRVVGDPWYASELQECRYGKLSDESYIFC